MARSELEKYKASVSAQFDRLSPLLHKYAMGDFSEPIPIPEEENEFTELLVGLNLMVDDIKELIQEKDKNITERKKSEEALQESEERFSLFMDYIPALIFIKDIESKTVYINKFMEEVLGAKGWIDKPLDEILPPDLAEKMREDDRKAFSEAYIKTVEIVPDKNGAERIFETRKFRIDCSGKPSLLGGIAMDVTERKRAEEQIIKINRLSNDLLVINDIDTMCKMTTDSLLDIFKADFARIWIINPGDLCNTDCYHAGITEGPHVCDHRDRCLHLVASSGRYTHIDGEIHKRVPFGCYKIGRVAAAEDSGFITNDVTHDPRVHDHKWAKELGLKSFAGYRLISHGDQPIGVMAMFSKFALSDKEETLLETISNSLSYAILRIKAMETLRESEEKYQLLVENAPSVLWKTNENGVTDFISSNIEELYGYTPEEIYADGYNSWFARINPDDLIKVEKSLQALFGKGVKFDVEYRIQKKDGGWIWLHDVAFVVHEENGVRYAYGVFTDITKRKKIEEQIQIDLKEKEVLLKEIHHRVKNNMQIMVSLLNLQAGDITDENLKTFLEVSRDRIRSMALIHEQLYKSEIFSSIEISKYIEHLALTIVDTYKVDNEKIDIAYDMNEIEVSLDVAIPFGLIVNELITNAIKYAFPPTWKKKGKVEIKLQAAKKDSILLSVGDNGIGLPEHIDFETTTSFGLKLIKLLSEDQLGGHVKLDRKGGTTFDIMFSTTNDK